MSKKFYVTTAIAYPNGKPHMGHALEILQADFIARYHRILGKEVVFQTGTDEHGVKNYETAKKLGRDVLGFIDENVAAFTFLYKELNITYTNFLRTTNKEVHYTGAQALWKKLVEAGDIYKMAYTGLYCVGCESFKTEKELEQGKCPNHPGQDIQQIEEENYFFRLSKYRDQLIELISSDAYEVSPEGRKNEILSFLKNAKDISFSRPVKSLPWGIPVPDDPEHVMYVWCDALSNYITGAGYGTDEKKLAETWPCDVHVIGKDILRFHAAFWPAMLLSAKEPLPKQLFVHGFLNIGGRKMSKSAGATVDPLDQLKKFGIDAFRFYMAAAMPMDSDGDYSEESVLERANNELVANLGNFSYRTLSFLKKNFEGKIDGIDENKDIINSVLELAQKAKDSFDKFNFRETVKAAMEISSIGNKYMQDQQPWKLVKSDPETGRKILGSCLNILKILMVIMDPIIPDFCKALREQLNINRVSWDDVNFDTIDHEINDAKIIINKINPEDLDTRPVFPLDLRVAKIISVEKHPEAEKLFIEQITYGEETSQIVSGLAKHYTAEELTGKHVIVVTNLKKAKLRGVDSFGMLLAASDETTVKVLEAPKSAPGSQVVPEGYKADAKQIKIDDFLEMKLKTLDKKVIFQGKALGTADETIIVDVPDGFEVG
ncbi:MAG: methionine--tRNA ligase [Spirochaetales bacterium]|nr:methionine--tRNA ligase [Spirochaetales bacterium]